MTLFKNSPFKVLVNIELVQIIFKTFYIKAFYQRLNKNNIYRYTDSDELYINKLYNARKREEGGWGGRNFINLE